MSFHHAHASDVDLSDEDDLDTRNPHASSTKWRHEESRAYRKYAGQHLEPRAEARNPKSETHDLADFLKSSRIAPAEVNGGSTRPRTSSATGGTHYQPIVIDGREARAAGEPSNAEADAANAAPQDGKTIVCGPLLNYKRMERNYWVGSVLIVTKGGGRNPPAAPILVLRRVGEARSSRAVASDGGYPTADIDYFNPHSGGRNGPSGSAEVQGLCLYSDYRNTFWRFTLNIEIEANEIEWEYSIPGMRYVSKKKPQENSFYVPAINESMRMMFHSCNGFSVGTDESAWSGPALWNDVMRRHAEVPLHVMIGGGDQIYNDGIRVEGPLRKWTEIGNPKKRRDYKFPEELRRECDDYYLNNYIRWYSTEPFASANGQIPQVNIWDDHDIVDGFGSYVNEFMKCDVFRGIGGCAHKYYMLFQHHLPPPPSTYTSDAPQTAAQAKDGQPLGLDAPQLVNTYVADPIRESNYIIGPKPGPYVAEHSQNIFAKLGARIALLGIDARTERTRHQVNYPETYDLIFERLSQELRDAQAAGTPFKHVILLLGIPIAYPRLTWLENIFSSPVLGPVKFANRRFGIGGSFFNHFDGSVDLLDDLDDHYTARTHKKERNEMVEKFQMICKQFSVRLTILGGDVHLAALGRFYSNPSLNIPIENDHRYMVNVVSSAIVNKPPPGAVANLLARRNKIHHLDQNTDETLLKLFNKDPGNSIRTAKHNQVTMPSRNYAILTENSPNNPPGGGGVRGGGGIVGEGGQHRPATAGTAATNGTAGGPNGSHKTAVSSRSSVKSKDGHFAIHAGEVGCGTGHRAASMAEHGRDNDGGLDICIRVEIDQHDLEGRTEAYGLTVPTLTVSE